MCHLLKNGNPGAAEICWCPGHPQPHHPRIRAKKIPNMKHVTYYLLVSISFPYIHTRQIGHNEGPQLLVVGELEQDTWALEG